VLFTMGFPRLQLSVAWGACPTNEITSLDAAMTIPLHIEDRWRGASEFNR